jgi:putative ABC transport system permease protein
MSLLESLRTAIDSLANHKLRSALAMLGIVFGVGAVIAMLAIGAGAERQALELIDAMGLRNVILRSKHLPDDELTEIRKRSLGLSQRDAQAVQEGVPAVEAVAVRLEIPAVKVLASGGKAKPQVFGVSKEYSRAARVRLAEGRFFDAADELGHGQVCVLGSRTRRDLFGYEPAVGRDVKVGDVWLTVVGVMEPPRSVSGQQQGISIESTEAQLLLPVTTASRKFEHEALKDELDEMLVTFREGADIRAAAAAVSALVDRLHGGAGDFTVTVPQALLEQSRQTQRLFSIVMGCIAGISLLVGGIGIMNILLATVMERTREIGVRRAIGARRKDVQRQFLIEAFTISVLGGAAGIAVGLLIAEAVAAYAGWPVLVTVFSVVLSTGVSLAVGLVSGIYPAWRAARLDPIEALRYE